MNGRTEKLSVYNITSGNTNPISWQEYLEYGREAAIERPSIRVVRPIATVMKGDGVSKFNGFLTKYVSEILFAYFIDLIMIILGHKTIMVRLMRRMHHAFDMLGYFARREWDFPSNNLIALYESMSTTDQTLFNIDVKQVKWREYIHDSYLGIRRYLLKEEDSNIEAARKRMKWVTLGYYTLLLVMFCALVSLVIFSPVTSMFLSPIGNAVSWTADRICSRYHYKYVQ